MNIRDIAQIANVTPGTVSKVINNYPGISAETRQRVLAAIQAKQYTPNASARSLKLASAAPHICIVVESANYDLYANVERSLSSRLHNAGYPISVVHDNYYAQDKTEKFKELISYVKGYSISGLIYIGGNFSMVPPELLSSLPCKAVYYNTVLPRVIEAVNYSSVGIDDYSEGYMQMEYLLKKGHRNIVVIATTQNDNSIYFQRLQGNLDALEKQGISLPEDHILRIPYDDALAYSGLCDFLKKYPKTSAVCCTADCLAIGASRAIVDSGKTAGKDIDLLSFDGLDEMQYFSPSISTIAQPVSQIMSYVYEQLTGLLNEKLNNQHICFKAVLVKRESCR
jgi:DNA-binding LacI/PurR family transcriptional regulator